MRIISDFHDYYDITLAHGSDPDNLYMRRTVAPRTNPPRPSLYNGNKHLILVSYQAVGFCGTVYPLIYINFQKRATDPIVSDYCYTAEQLQQVLQKHNIVCDEFTNDVFYRISVFEFFDEDLSYYNSLFLKHKVPCFSIVIDDINRRRRANGEGRECVTLNPQLNLLKFYRVFDAAHAYQELEMYMSSVLCTEKDHKQVDDDYRYTGHGYNKESFRKPAGEKKPRKKKNKNK